MNTALMYSDCPDLSLLHRGKVRDIYDVDDEHLLFVASDRLSAFDVIMSNGIPDKGKILTQLSLFWFDKMGHLGANHLVTGDIDAMPAPVRAYAQQLRGRSMLVRKVDILPVEAIVRGYLAGSGWTEYKRQGTICDLPLPEGLVESDRLQRPLYTPSTKAEIGSHDENIHPDRAIEILGAEHAAAVEERSIALYEAARDYAASRGIIIADTKFEFGLNKQGEIVLADEILTPDSSRFWRASIYETGRSQNSLDKQFVRDWLERSDFDKDGAGIELPSDIVAQTRERYIEVFRILSGDEPEV